MDAGCPADLETLTHKECLEVSISAFSTRVPLALRRSIVSSLPISVVVARTLNRVPKMRIEKSGIVQDHTVVVRWNVWGLAMVMALLVGTVVATNELFGSGNADIMGVLLTCVIGFVGWVTIATVRNLYVNGT
jgi:hypothetical protein